MNKYLENINDTTLKVNADYHYVTSIKYRVRET